MTTAATATARSPSTPGMYGRRGAPGMYGRGDAPEARAAAAPAPSGTARGAPLLSVSRSSPAASRRGRSGQLYRGFARCATHPALPPGRRPPAGRLFARVAPGLVVHELAPGLEVALERGREALGPLLGVAERADDGRVDLGRQAHDLAQAVLLKALEGGRRHGPDALGARRQHEVLEGEGQRDEVVEVAALLHPGGIAARDEQAEDPDGRDPVGAHHLLGVPARPLGVLLVAGVALGAHDPEVAGASGDDQLGDLAAALGLPHDEDAPRLLPAPRGRPEREAQEVVEHVIVDRPVGVGAHRAALADGFGDLHGSPSSNSGRADPLRAGLRPRRAKERGHRTPRSSKEPEWPRPTTSRRPARSPAGRSAASSSPPRS